MTKEEAKNHQQRQGNALGWYYATSAEKCCEVYPKLMTVETNDPKDIYLECEVCGKRTELFTMPWLAARAWNEHHYRDQQLSLEWE